MPDGSDTEAVSFCDNLLALGMAQFGRVLFHIW
jgi:hypothetical protein